MSRKNKKLDEYSLADLFREIELELIASAKQNLSRHVAWEQELGFEWEQWQLAKLRSLNQYRINNRKIIRSYKSEIENIIQEVIESTYSDAYKEAVKVTDEIFADMNIEMDSSALLFSDVEVPEENFFHINDDKINVIIDEMQKTFVNSEGVTMRKMDDTYRQVLDKAVLKLGAGTTSINKAIDESTKEFLSKGIDSITYKDGRRVNIASYAEMYLRTANQQASFYAQGKARDRMGVYTVLMSQHENCSPMCLPYQGTVMIDDVFTSLSKDDAVQIARETGYTRLSTAMENHAFHPNCRHSLSTWFPGKSTVPKAFTQEQNVKAIDRYKREQEQRILENKIRKWKRVEVGSLDPTNKKTAQTKVKQYQGKLRNHIKQNPNLRRKYWRERTEPMLNLRQEEVVNKYTPPLPYEDVTQEWLDAIDHNKVGNVIENDYFKVDGVRYDSSNSYLEHSFDENEEATVAWLNSYFHEDIRKVPRTAPYDNGKKFIKTPDIIFKDDYWEIKIPKGNSKSTIRDRVADAKGQANNFIIDIKETKMLEQDALSYVQALFSQYNTNFVDYAMLVNGEKLITILKKR